MIIVPEMLPYGESTASLVTPAEGHCADDEYIGFDGLRCCSRCHAKREIRVKFYGKERIFPALCKCQEEERDGRAREQEQRDFQLRRERLREDGLENKAYYAIEQ